MSDLGPDVLAAMVVLPLGGAAISLAFKGLGTVRSVKVERVLAMLVVLANLGFSLAILTHTLGDGGRRLVLQSGNWAAPFGISLVADGLAAIMLTLTALLAVAAVPFAIGTLDRRERMHFHPIVLFLLAGVNGAFLAGDLFNLYVFFEVLLMSSFVLLTLGGQSGQVNGGIRYVVLNLLASLIFLMTAGIAYGTLGTLNMAQLADRLDQAPEFVGYLMAGLMLVSFSSKAGLFPLYFWLPRSYHTPHPAVTAFFGGLLTKVGIYTLFRMFTLLFPDLLDRWQTLILAIAGFTMFTGVLGAMAVPTIRRVLSFHIISQVGYMVMGLGLVVGGETLFSGFALAAGILYLVHHMIVKTALLMAGGAAELEMGSGNLTRGQLRGLAGSRPVLAVLFFLAAFSLAGVPPSSGFVSKLALLRAAFDADRYVIATVSLVVSFFTLMSMVRLWQSAFWGRAVYRPSPHSPLASPSRRALTLVPIGFLVTLSLGIGLFSGQVFEYSKTAASQALDRDGYIDAVAPTDEIELIEKHEDGEEAVTSGDDPEDDADG